MPSVPFGKKENQMIYKKAIEPEQSLRSGGQSSTIDKALIAERIAPVSLVPAVTVLHWQKRLGEKCH